MTKSAFDQEKEKLYNFIKDKGGAQRVELEMFARANNMSYTWLKALMALQREGRVVTQVGEPTDPVWAKLVKRFLGQIKWLALEAVPEGEE